MSSKPTHEQAQLHLQVFEQRREARLRQARDWFMRNYFAESLDEAMRIAGPGTEHGIFVNMVSGYWEQTCALLNYGLLHEDLFFETTGEFWVVWERVKPGIEQARQVFKNPHFLSHIERAAKRFEEWSEARTPGHVATMRQWMQQMRSQMQSAKAA
ncbi:MAG: hypothetical protein ROO76_06100 [Terriglobia bacterium]|nr:hypothetical protein [Terriglobia bacterium]